MRRQDDMRRQLDSLDSDRNIFEDIVGRLTSLEEKIKHSRNHDEETTKDIKQEINTAMQRVEDKVEEVQDSLDEKKVVHVKKLSWWDRLSLNKRLKVIE